MTFDFFNTSHLAFGSKLTKAFLQLDRLCTEAEENQANLKLILQEYEQYSNRNYKAPFPTRPDAPCRTNEIFDIINDLNSIKYIRLNSDGNLECAINLFKRVSNRFTIASGTTELKEGYASVIDSVSNARPEREIQFTETYPTSGNFLFQFKIEDGNINILGDSKAYFLPGDFNHIIGMEYEKDISTSSYTAEGDECIVCVGQGGAGADSIWPLTVKVNDKIKVDAKTKNTKNFAVIYPKKGDVITGNMSRAFKIKYLAKEVAIPSSFVVDENGLVRGTYQIVQQPTGIHISEGKIYGDYDTQGYFSMKILRTVSPTRSDEHPVTYVSKLFGPTYTDLYYGSITGILRLGSGTDLETYRWLGDLQTHAVYESTQMSFSSLVAGAAFTLNTIKLPSCDSWNIYLIVEIGATYTKMKMVEVETDQTVYNTFSTPILFSAGQDMYIGGSRGFRPGMDLNETYMLQDGKIVFTLSPKYYPYLNRELPDNMKEIIIDF